MARAVRLDRIGGPEVLRLEQVEVGEARAGATVLPLSTFTKEARLP
jgi:hypothetical protein